ncbi:cysteine-rich secretory protein LCCL domain-containing 1 [Trichomycterus rosablanca]|uniref:cysteine-rich secretory protein LCCL domain-containing 1 n=1 Tax=Trichomycterus rosablanca TaxID=2290929 RepID=UPI002F358173
MSGGWVRGLALVFLSQSAFAMTLFNSTHLGSILEKYGEEGGAKPRGRRAISAIDKQAILELHNKLRGQVYPHASNMEYMVWDDELERSAEQWAETCLWEHGPEGLLNHIGQNLGVHWGRYRPPTSHVQAWYDEVKDFTFPYPQECNPYCPFRCSGPVCTHYTQLVWATSSRIGCAVNMCYNMNVWGQIWTKAVYLVCNYSPKGNWWGNAPYKHGTPCSACPPSYGGGCRENLCYKDDGYRYHVETERDNQVEPEAVLTTRRPDPQPHAYSETVVSTEQMSQLVSCDTKLRDRCKGTTCNRYECPAGCLDSAARVIGTVYYDMHSSVCRAAIHYGVIDNDGGWLDVSREGRKAFFIRSYKNGIQSVGKYYSANAFSVSRVDVKVVTCDTTVASLCPYESRLRHCPRIYCPHACLQEPSQISRVIGTRTYSDDSSVCRAAVHAGVIKDEAGGYVDVMPLETRMHFHGSHQNHVSSESLYNPDGAKAFRVFAII